MHRFCILFCVEFSAAWFSALHLFKSRSDVYVFNNVHIHIHSFLMSKPLSVQDITISMPGSIEPQNKTTSSPSSYSSSSADQEH